MNKNLLRHYQTLVKSRDTLSLTVEGTRKKLAKDCTHPAELVSDYRWEHDNGYGRQHMNTGSMCGICYGKDPYKTGTFYRRDELSEY